MSLNTVRTHTKHIYAKLGVNNRRAAVRRAQELDLLARTPTAAAEPTAAAGSPPTSPHDVKPTHHIGSYLADIRKDRTHDADRPDREGGAPVISTDTGQPHERSWYEIRLQGRLDPRWSAWFDGLTLTAGADGTTTLRGPVVDQAALHGLLQQSPRPRPPADLGHPGGPDPAPQHRPEDSHHPTTGDTP